jgi:hypothetical protein
MHKYVHVIIGNEGVGGGIHFPAGAHGYTYFNHVPETEVGDIVIVGGQLAHSTRPKTVLRFAKVIEAHSDDDRGKPATKWIVDRLDIDKYEAVSQLVPEDFVKGVNK